MQSTSMALKLKVQFDGKEYPGLTKFGEVSLEKGTIEVPTFSRINKIDNGIITMPEVTATFETQRNTATRKFLQNYYLNGEEHDLTIILTDADGVEFERQSWISTRCRVLKSPEIDLASPTYAQIQVAFLPFDIKVL